MRKFLFLNRCLILFMLLNINLQNLTRTTNLDQIQWNFNIFISPVLYIWNVTDIAALLTPACPVVRLQYFMINNVIIKTPVLEISITKASLIAINQIDFTNYRGHITTLLPAPSAIPIYTTYIKDKLYLQHQDANDVIALTPE